MEANQQEAGENEGLVNIETARKLLDRINMTVPSIA
jgi:hypothetical protein